MSLSFIDSRTSSYPIVLKGAPGSGDGILGVNSSVKTINPILTPDGGLLSNTLGVHFALGPPTTSICLEFSPNDFCSLLMDKSNECPNCLPS